MWPSKYRSFISGYLGLIVVTLLLIGSVRGPAFAFAILLDFMLFFCGAVIVLIVVYILWRIR